MDEHHVDVESVQAVHRFLDAANRVCIIFDFGWDFRRDKNAFAMDSGRLESGLEALAYARFIFVCNRSIDMAIPDINSCSHRRRGHIVWRLPCPQCNFWNALTVVQLVRFF